jgi:hypothetical protein
MSTITQHIHDMLTEDPTYFQQQNNLTPLQAISILPDADEILYFEAAQGIAYAKPAYAAFMKAFLRHTLGNISISPANYLQQNFGITVTHNSQKFLIQSDPQKILPILEKP